MIFYCFGIGGLYLPPRTPRYTEEMFERSMNRDFIDYFRKIRKILSAKKGRNEILKSICVLLQNEVEHYNWVGFYFLDKARNELVLGPYAGAATDHTNIQIGRGICGQVAETKQTRIIQDVSKEDNYLSCSINVKSEIVIPIMKDGEFIAELDIDSHFHSPFSDDDREFLEKVGSCVAELFIQTELYEILISAQRD